MRPAIITRSRALAAAGGVGGDEPVVIEPAGREAGQGSLDLVESIVARKARGGRDGSVLLGRPVLDVPLRGLVLRIDGAVDDGPARAAAVDDGRGRQADRDLLDERGARTARRR